jgi:hypothetical protein
MDDRPVKEIGMGKFESGDLRESRSPQSPAERVVRHSRVGNSLLVPAVIIAAKHSREVRRLGCGAAD